MPVIEDFCPRGIRAPDARMPPAGVADAGRLEQSD